MPTRSFDEEQKYESKQSEAQQPVIIAEERLNRLEKIANEIEDVKKDFMLIVGIFASVVAFLTVEAKIFDPMNSQAQNLGFSCFILAGLLAFLLLLRSTLSSSVKDAWKMLLYPVSWLILGLMTLGTILVK